MKTIDIYKEIFDHFPEANSLENLVPGMTYKTMRAKEMFTHLKFNRGTECGYVPSIVSKLVAKIISGDYKPEIGCALINKLGVVLLSNNNVESTIETKIWTLFRVTCDDRLNIPNGLELNSILSDINAYKTDWNNDAIFQTALRFNIPLAVGVQTLLAKMMACPELNITSKNLTTNQIMTLADEFNVKTHSKKRSLNDYNNEKMTDHIKTEKCYQNLYFMCEVITVLEYQKCTVDTSKVFENLLWVMRKYSNKFSKESFLINLKKHSFKVSEIKIGEIRQKIQNFGNSDLNVDDSMPVTEKFSKRKK